MLRMMITGAGDRSFIGRNLREYLGTKYQVFAPSHRELELMDYNALEEYVLKNKIQVLIHAAVHVPMFNGKENEYLNDMRMFLNIEKISHRLKKVLYFGSGAEFDKTVDLNMVRETDIGVRIPHTEYGLAKYTMNMIARGSDNIYNLRLFGVYGKYELWNIKFISNLCCKAVYGLPLTIRKDCEFDYLYIDDLMMVVEWFLQNEPAYHDYNVSLGKPYTLYKLAQIVREIAGRDLEIRLLSKELNRNYTSDNTRLRSEIKNLSFAMPDRAIIYLYRYYVENRGMIDYETIKNSF